MPSIALTATVAERIGFEFFMVASNRDSSAMRSGLELTHRRKPRRQPSSGSRPNFAECCKKNAGKGFKNRSRPMSAPGQKADLTTPKSDFRFTPESRHTAGGGGGWVLWVSCGTVGG